MARRRRSGTLAVLYILMLVLGALAYKYWPEYRTRTASPTAAQRSSDIALVGQASDAGQVALRKITGNQDTNANEPTTRPASSSVRPEVEDALGDAGFAPADQGHDPTDRKKPIVPLPPEKVDKLIESADRAMRAEDWGQARKHYSHALAGLDPGRTPGLGDPKRDGLLEKLRQIADDTVFSKRIRPGDTLSAAHTVVAGERLRGIAKKFKVTDDLLARINGLPDKNQIQAGQRLKIVRGPFHAIVYKKRFEMEVYLADTLVRRYRVGLGEDDGTPTGTWRVQNKLVNPTYYPPRGGNRIAADDPTNPLGERWIGLEGIAGDAVGQQKYGIHGTIEPESIGKNMSLGCIRLLNPDVEELYTLLVENVSTVIVKP